MKKRILARNEEHQVAV